jgi:chromosome segregation ATPase
VNHRGKKMGDKDLENIISSIGQEELAVAQKQAQIDRLKQLMVKQKNEMTDQQKIIDDLNNRMHNMYDLPADVEELKRMVGEMRAEINDKDSQLQMAYGTVAEHEAELRNLRLQMDPLAKNLETYITQVGELKAKMAEHEGLLMLKDKDIHELKTNLNNKQANFDNMEVEFAKKVQERLKEFMETEDNYQKKLAEIQEELREKSMTSDEARIKIKAELQEDVLKTQTEYMEKVRILESQLLDKDIEFKEANQKMENAINQVQDIKQKLDTQVEKYNKLQKDYSEIKDEMDKRDEFYADLKEFKEKNFGVAENLTRLMTLFEHEPMFKTFLLVKDVGEMNIEYLKNSLGLPSVTTKKYVDLFIEADLFIMTESGKVALKYPIKGKKK